MMVEGGGGGGGMSGSGSGSMSCSSGSTGKAMGYGDVQGEGSGEGVWGGGMVRSLLVQQLVEMEESIKQLRCDWAVR